MPPAQRGQAQTAPSTLADLLVDIALFPPEATKGRIEAGPGRFTAAEDSQPLHRDLERLPLRIDSSGIGRPGAPHLRPPHGIEVRGDGLEIVVDDWALEEIPGVGMVLVIGFQARDGIGSEQDMGVAAEHRLAACLAEDTVSSCRGTDGFGGPDVAPLVPVLDEG